MDNKIKSTPVNPSETDILRAVITAMADGKSKVEAMSALASLERTALYASLEGKGWAVGVTGAWRGPKGERCALQVHVGTPGRGNINVPPEMASALAEATDGLPTPIRERIKDTLRDPGVALFWSDGAIAAKYGAKATIYPRPSKDHGWIKVKDETDETDGAPDTKTPEARKASAI